MKKRNESQLPIIDIGSLWSDAPDGKLADIGEQVYEACRSMGFFYVANHGLDKTVVDDAFTANRWFHAQPLEEKLKIKINKWHRGYQTFAGSTLVSSARFAPARHPNQLESFFVRHEMDPADQGFMVEPLQGPNQWPDDEKFKTTVTRYDSGVRDVGMRLLRVFSVSIGEEPGFFARRSGRSMWRPGSSNFRRSTQRRASSSSLQPCGCCSTGSSLAKSSRQIRPLPCAAQSMS